MAAGEDERFRATGFQILGLNKIDQESFHDNS
jgi:hypothetical protein